MAWQFDEYLRVSLMLPRLAWANERRSRLAERKLKFGGHRQQFLLLFHERRSADRSADFSPHVNSGLKSALPLIFFLHGGGWGHGNPENFRFIGRFFAEAGFPTIVSGYRLAPRYKFPSQLEDAYAGLAAGLKLAASHGLWPAPVILAGQSAGAQLASLMLLDRERLRARGFEQSSFAGLLLVSGLLNFAHCQTRKDREMLKNYIGRPADWPNADPIRFVRGDETVPVIAIHGERDLLVHPANSLSFVHKLNHNSELYLAPDAYHTDLTRMFVEPLPATQVMLEWLERIAKLGSTRTEAKIKSPAGQVVAARMKG